MGILRQLSWLAITSGLTGIASLKWWTRSCRNAAQPSHCHFRRMKTRNLTRPSRWLLSGSVQRFGWHLLQTEAGYRREGPLEAGQVAAAWRY